MGVCKPQKISRELYERVKSDGMARKAIAALLMVRKSHSSSAITRYTHRKFTQEIVEIQNRKDFLMHASNNAQKPKPNAKAKAIKAATLANTAIASRR